MEAQMKTRVVLPDRLRGIREAAGLSQTKAAKAAGLTKFWLNKVEAGSRTPSPDALDALCQVYAKRLNRDANDLYQSVTAAVSPADAA